MNADQIAIVQETFEKVRPISETAAELFYKRLFELNPSFKPLFKGDMKKQGRILWHCWRSVTLDFRAGFR
jgi:hemoglobin-like flavoprotein